MIAWNSSTDSSMQDLQTGVACATKTTMNSSAHPADNATIGPGEEPMPPAVMSAGVTLGILISLLGLFGNLVLIFSVLLTKHLHKTSNIFVVSLAFCDLWQVALVHPLYIYTYAKGVWEFGPRVCMYVLYASNFAILLSILHVSVIAFQRYLIIVHPKTAPRFQTVRATISLLVLIFSLTLLIILAPASSRLTKDYKMGVHITFNTKIMFCCSVKTRSSIAGILKKVGFLGLVGVWLSYCYVRLYRVVRKSGREIHSKGQCTHSRLKREMKILKTMLVIFLTFIICYMPMTIVYGVDYQHEFSHGAYFTTVMLLWTSSSVNWIIYGMMNKQYYNAYRIILCCANPQFIKVYTSESNNGSVPLSVAGVA